MAALNAFLWEGLVKHRRVWAVVGISGLIGMLLLADGVAGAQTPSPVNVSSPSDSLSSAVHDLQQQVKELRAAVAEMRAEAAQYRAETAELRREMAVLRGTPEGMAQPGSYAGSSGSEPTRGAQTVTEVAQAPSLEQRVATLEETSQLTNSKLEDQYQTKVEAASKYRVRLSGMVLMNLFSDRGQTDNQDIPSFVTGANQGNGDFGATLRQSEIGLEVFGPTLAGAKTSANLQADFAGGFSNTWNGVNSGIFRLRIASARMDWQHTSVVVGQDDLFISPLSPTSFASLAVPAFNYAGNLWAWTPQVRVEHRFDISDH
jgi:outer membrane murein-binding lipoprotein Lpp